MDDSLAKHLKAAATRKGMGLMTHVIVGYPSLEANWRMLEIMAAHDVDTVEMQLPFSEPAADGPVFAQANQAAIANGMNQQRYFDFMARAAKHFDFPILMMGYYNSIFSQGEAAFCQRLEESGGRGLIVPDLPPAMATSLISCAQAQNLAFIPLVTPYCSDDRLKVIANVGQGFVYVVARKGVTGRASTTDSGAMRAYLERCRQASTLPIAVGFGIQNAQQLADLRGQADIAIIGTAVLQAWQQGGANAVDAFFTAVLKP